MARRTLEDAFKAGYMAGFCLSGEGYNGEYPFDQKGISPDADEHWVASRDHALTRYKEKQNAD